MHQRLWVMRMINEILNHLSVKALSRHDLARIVSLDELRTMGILRKLRESNEIRVNGYGLYERFYGYGPGGAA